MPEIWSERDERTSSVLDAGIGDCEFCGAKHVRCLFFDTSDAEYMRGSVCQPCLQKLFAEVQDAQAG